MITNDTLSAMMSLAGPILTAAGLISAVWWRMESKVETVRVDADKAVKEAKDATHTIEKQLNEFKLEVTKEYASWDTVKAIESRLTERMDTLSDQVMKMPEVIVDRIMKYLSLNPAK